MKVLLKKDVDNLGYAGEVLKVADGYGRNYLIPRGLAVQASPSVLKQAQSWRERAAIRLTELRREHEALAARINSTNLNFYARAGESGKLYGSVTTVDVTDQLNEVLGTEIDRKIVTGGPLRQLGEHRITVRLSRDYQPQVTIHIHPFAEEEETVEVEEEFELDESAVQEEVPEAEEEFEVAAETDEAPEVEVEDTPTSEVEEEETGE